MKEIRFSYKACPTIKQFSQSDQFLRGIMGPFGSGKSSGCVIEIIRRSMQQEPDNDGIRRTRWAVIRNTYQQLRDTSIKTFLDWVPPRHFGRYTSNPYPVYTITGIGGAEIEVLFRALDRPDQIDNLLSLELTGAWVNEAREVPWTIIEALQGRVGRYPSRREGGPTWFGVFMDTNPPDEDGWWYRLFEEQRPNNAEVFKQPSGRSKAAENRENLPDGYYNNLLSSMDEETARVYVDGKYGFIRTGKPVFPEYDDNTHCKDVSVIPGATIYRGWDFGLTPACVMSQLDPRGQWRIIDECTSERSGIDRFADDVLAHCSRTYTDYDFEDIGDPAGNNASETDEKTCFAILRGKGVDIRPGEQTISMRLESVRKPLNSMIDGEPGLILDPKCRMLRKGFQGRYHYRRMMTSEEKYTDKPDKNEHSHVHDATQYVATKLFGQQVRNAHRKARREEEHEEFVVGGAQGWMM